MGAVRVTAADVARVAGVSRSTVSYILNGSSKASFPAETVARVQDAARMLRYTPHAAARALRRGEASVVLAVVQSTPQSSSMASLLDELSASMATRGMSLVTWTASPETSLRTVLRDVTPHVIVEIMPLSDDDRAVAASSGVALASAIDSMTIWEHAVGEQQVAHLASLGHDRIGIVTVDEPRMEFLAAQRRRGVEQAALRHGAEVVDAIALGPPSPETRDLLASRLTRWQTMPKPVTAAVCYNDQFAALTLAAAAACGITVPQSLSVVGVDDEPLSAWLTPPLTTTRLEMLSIARHVAALIDRAIGGDEASVGTTQSTAAATVTLVERETTAHAASSDQSTTVTSATVPSAIEDSTAADPSTEPSATRPSANPKSL